MKYDSFIFDVVRFTFISTRKYFCGCLHILLKKSILYALDCTALWSRQVVFWNSNASDNRQFQLWPRSQGQISWFSRTVLFLDILMWNIKAIALTVLNLLTKLKVFFFLKKNETPNSMVNITNLVHTEKSCH